MNRPNVEENLTPLKPFQRRTVDHAFKQLFLTENGTSRFLVADEVGLGKTLVARGIIARTIDYLWEKVDRIDIVYVCSNQNIARANLPKLHIGGQESLKSASRLTLLIKELAADNIGRSFLESKLNFVSFTPTTSFEFGRSTGRSDEREVLFHLLKKHILHRPTTLMNLLQCQVKDKDQWRRRLQWQPPLEPSIRKLFDDEFIKQPALFHELVDALDRFKNHKDWYPHDACVRRSRVVGKLRHLLAEVSLTVLEPDLVILDEFQRFKPLLETSAEKQSEAAHLAQALFNVKAEHDDLSVRTLLLSATPYKPYTADAELGQEDHYQDFVKTASFLFNNNQERVQELQSGLAQFGTTLKRIANADEQSLDLARQHKRAVEHSLTNIMARTERVPASKARDSMVLEVQPALSIAPQDVRQYLEADSLFQAVGDQDPIALWKSAPYLVHFMTGYKFNERLDEALKEGNHVPVAEALSKYPKSVISADMIRSLQAIDPAHAKLRQVVKEYVDTGLWRLLWLPPTIPYWTLEGTFKTVNQTTKTLMFSAWNVVPDAVSAMLSYEIERRMFAGGAVDAYENPTRQQGPVLKFEQQANRNRSSHRNLLLLLPCLPLSDLHPLEFRGRGNIRNQLKKRIKNLLADSGLLEGRRGPVDNRWIWAAPVLLDDGLRSFLEQWRDGKLKGKGIHTPEPNAVDQHDHFSDYLTDLIEFDSSKLGKPPRDLENLLVDLTLGSPAVLIARTLGAFNVSETTRRTLAFEVAGAFRKLFNRPAVISLLRTLASKKKTKGTVRYWRLVLDYCRQGCLQAVLDEHWHLLWDQASFAQDFDPDVAARECAQSLHGCIEPVPARVHAHFFKTNGSQQISEDPLRIRTVFALRFGHVRSEDEKRIINQDAVRNAFNSPFRPFLLASTSIGQEGLDFHQWCHRLLHWNLPSNPVDLEQREGRVHRYDGHAVRKNVAEQYAERAFANWKLGVNLWSLMFKYAEQDARNANESDLVPHWISDGDCKVERIVPLLPYSTEQAQFERLKRQLVAYRVVFGQPRQEELLNILGRTPEGTGLSAEQLAELTIDLTPHIGQSKD